MSIQVYVIMGSVGEYSNYQSWTVGAYQDKARANEHARLALDEAAKIQKERPNRHSKPTRPNPYDPYMSLDYTGTDYYVVAVDLLDAIPGIDG